MLAAVFGQFSHLWVNLCRQFGLDVDAIELPWGEGTPLELYEQRLRADKTHQIKAVLVCHNETATGVTSDVGGVRKALDAAGHPALLMVDGVSSIGCIEFDVETWGVDVAVCGSQKGFMMPTGLAIVAVSQKALQARATARLPRCFFDFNDMILANKDGYFPYTPATTSSRAARPIELLESEGLEQVFAHAIVGLQRACAKPLTHGGFGYAQSTQSGTPTRSVRSWCRTDWMPTRSSRLPIIVTTCR